jgi:predicted glutamate--cysteine ligase
MKLLKGFEIEIFTSSLQGNSVGLSDSILENNIGFFQEPDSRNVEYITAPLQDYNKLLIELIVPRIKLRKYLSTLGKYTLMPGSTLSLGDSNKFFRSDPKNKYHDFIEASYGTNVVTASIHINIGIDDPDLLFRACRLIRMEAPLFLALSASSPFIDSNFTGYHSTRWKIFPQTPKRVPLFKNHEHYIRWCNLQMSDGIMKNVRHLWSSVRPNGDQRPYSLNRLELRICDLIVDPYRILAIAALLEARIHQLILDPTIDPLISSSISELNREKELIDLTLSNEIAAAHLSLDATLRHWQSGKNILARDWIQKIYEGCLPISKKLGFKDIILPIQKILNEGNDSMKWLFLLRQGFSPAEIVTASIQDMLCKDKNLGQSFSKYF